MDEFAMPGMDFQAKKGSNVLVCARFRPQNQLELAKSGKTLVTFGGDGADCTIENEEGNKQTFTFDRVFDEFSKAADVYEYAARPIVEDVINGYYATVFAYGQTGSGKTFTMEGIAGDEDRKGVIPRAVEHLFDIVTSSSENVEVTFGVQYVEIYMERIRDLLDKKQQKNNLEVRVDVHQGVYVEGATMVEVSTDTDVLKLLQSGSLMRHVSATGMNEESSRSHAIFMITVTQKNMMDLTVKTGKLFLVDLAGSEMVSKTGATDQRLEEAKQINKSLSALGNVIKALTDGKSSHIPYRDSKLTRILQDSLGGSSRASLIVACSPSMWNQIETVSTLRFGNRAKFIKNKPKLHVGYGGTQMDEVLQKREEEINQLRDQLEQLGAASANTMKLNQRYLACFGELPEDNEVEAEQVGEDGEAVEAPPPVNFVERLEKEREYSASLNTELASIRKEALISRKAVEELHKHLVDEKSLFSQLRSEISGLVRKGGTEENGLAADGKRVDQMVNMAKWKVDEVLKKMDSASAASKQVEAAANVVRDKHANLEKS